MKHIPLCSYFICDYSGVSIIYGLMMQSYHKSVLAADRPLFSPTSSPSPRSRVKLWDRMRGNMCTRLCSGCFGKLCYGSLCLDGLRHFLPRPISVDFTYYREEKTQIPVVPFSYGQWQGFIENRPFENWPNFNFHFWAFLMMSSLRKTHHRKGQLLLFLLS